MIERTNDDRVDLEWLYNEADGELGPQSPGFEGSGDKPAGTSETAERHAERAMYSSERIRRMGDILRDLSKMTEYTLRMAFTRGPRPRPLAKHPPEHFYAACSSQAMRAFLASLGLRQWSAKQSCEWLIRAEDPKKDAGVPIESLVELQTDTWTQAERTVDQALNAFAMAREAYDALPATKRRKRLFGGDKKSAA